jgi:RNA polymerase primary sigma factor
MKASNTSNWNENTIYQQYLKDVSKHPLLEKSEEVALIKLVSQGNKKAMDKLVVSNLRFVINIAFMYKNQGMTVSELINEGNLGLMEAARRFDPDQKIKFISYAVWWIRQSITRSIAERGRLVRISAEKELVLRRLNKLSKKSTQTYGGQFVVDANELEGKTDYTAEQIQKILTMGLRHASLDAPVGEDGDNSMMDLTIDADAESDTNLLDKSNSEYISNSVEKLPAQEKQVLSLYFGIGLPYSMNLNEIGKQIGLSKERVRQVKEKGLAHLRSMGLAAEFTGQAA